MAINFLFGWASGNNIDIPKKSNGETDIGKLFEMYNNEMNNLAKKTSPEKVEQDLFLKIMDKDYFNKFTIDELKRVAKGDLKVDKENFSKQVDAVINGKHKEYLDLYVCKTPQILQDVGLPNKPILMRNSKIKEILTKHSEMTVDLLKEIPEAINNPDYILTSKTNPKESIVVISSINTSKGKMVVPIWIEQEGTYLDLGIKPIKGKTNFTASAYGRNIQPLIDYAKANNGVLYKK